MTEMDFTIRSPAIRLALREKIDDIAHPAGILFPPLPSSSILFNPFRLLRAAPKNTKKDRARMQRATLYDADSVVRCSDFTASYAIC